MDDVWLYDINAHRWVAVYPGTDTNTFNRQVSQGEIFIDGHGQVAHRSGTLLPVHVLVHAWDFLSYDTHRHRFVFLAGSGLGRYYLPGLDAIETGLKTLEAQRASTTIPPLSPWSYDAATHRFGRDLAQNEQPDVGGHPTFVYVPERDSYFVAGSRGVATFDLATRRWTKLADQGRRPPGYDHGGCLGTRRQRLYMGSGSAEAEGLFVFDIPSSTWRHVEAEGQPRRFRTNEAALVYNESADRLTIFHRKDRKLYVFNPGNERWTTVPLHDAVLNSVPYGALSAFYDPVLDVYFVFLAADSRDNGIMWVYRHPQASRSSK